MNGTTLISLLSPLVAVSIAIWGFRRTSRSDQLKAFFDLQQRYLSAEVRRGRKLVHSALPEQMAGIDPEIGSAISHMLAVLNTIAIAVEGRYVDFKMVAQSMGKSYSSAVLAAKPYIDHLEAVRGFRPFPFAERLATELSRSVHIANAGA